MHNENSVNAPLIVGEAQIRAALPWLDLRQALYDMFHALGSGTAVQPSQTRTLFPNNAGNFICYLGVLAEKGVFGAKLSPFMANPGAPLVTAWTALMSMQHGHPLLWCDAKLLTRERTAATTALAVEHLAPTDCNCLTIIGSGSLAQAHLRYVLPLRNWQCIRVYSPSLADETDRQEQLQTLDPRLEISASCEQAVTDSDVVMLCTSSPKPVLNLKHLRRPALITSISTSGAEAHEIEADELTSLDVYCDHRASTPQHAGEMVLASRLHGWAAENVVGDLAELVNRHCPQPTYQRHVFFRSIGMGLEDIASAYALLEYLQQRK